MGQWQIAAILYIVVLNLIGFLSMGIDKSRAKKGDWRIPERTLFLIALLGGSVGSILGMQVFRHKTKHKSFLVGMPLILALQLLLLGLLAGHTGKQTNRTDFVMATVMSQVIYGSKGEETAEENYQIAIALEQEYLSWRLDASTVSEINRALSQGQSIELEPEEAQWIRESLGICEASGGALDITIHPVIELWGMETDTPKVPAEEEIQAALGSIGYERLNISEDGILTGKENSSIDLGALGKGIACDEIRENLEQRGITGAVISVGGTILVYGRKPGKEDWQIGIRDPRGVPGSLLGTLYMNETAVVSTSGDYERYFEENGIRYHHIFDPSTGYPADNGLISVTIVSEQGIVSDGLSTACFVMGYPESIPLLEQYEAEGIFVTKDQEVYVTEGLKDSFTLTAEGYKMMK